MNIGLGIDTGGTYTDSVLIDLDSGKVLAKAKALTTRHDLSIGILKSIELLGDIDASSVNLVSLSTTLATNAIVEGKGGRVCLIAIGVKPELIRNAFAGGSQIDFLFVIRGGHDIYGNKIDDLDIERAREVIQTTCNEVDAYAISAYGGVRNPEHEIAVKKLVRSICSLPVVCGHELSDRLDSLKRAVTAAFNARLIPMISELIDCVRRSLRDKGITAPIMVVKGDGHMMSCEMAMDRPIETILSGPAASMVGGHVLSGRDTGIVVDMGGTTTDIAVLRDGFPELNKSGARVGKWRTSILAADIHTCGIGGDSHIVLDPVSGFQITPKRVIPICLLAASFPQVKGEIRRIGDKHRTPAFSYQPSDFLVLSREDEQRMNSEMGDILVSLRTGPKSMDEIAAIVGRHPSLIDVSRLENMGLVARSGLTPTDVLHYMGKYQEWDREAATLLIELYAAWLGLSPDKLVSRVIDSLEFKMALEIMAKMVADNSGQEKRDDCRLCDWMWSEILGKSHGADFDLSVRLKMPVIAIGAPVQSYLPGVVSRLGTELIIPEHAEVANAVGAITGGIVQVVNVRIDPIYTVAGIAGYYVHAPTARHTVRKRRDAIRIAEKEATSEAERLARQAGATRVSVDVEFLNMESNAQAEIGEKVLLEMYVRAIARGELD